MSVPDLLLEKPTVHCYKGTPEGTALRRSVREEGYNISVARQGDGTPEAVVGFCITEAFSSPRLSHHQGFEATEASAVVVLLRLTRLLRLLWGVHSPLPIEALELLRLLGLQSY